MRRSPRRRARAKTDGASADQPPISSIGDNAPPSAQRNVTRSRKAKSDAQNYADWLGYAGATVVSVSERGDLGTLFTWHVDGGAGRPRTVRAVARRTVPIDIAVTVTFRLDGKSDAERAGGSCRAARPARGRSRAKNPFVPALAAVDAGAGPCGRGWLAPGRRARSAIGDALAGLARARRRRLWAWQRFSACAGLRRRSSNSHALADLSGAFALGAAFVSGVVAAAAP